MARISMKGPGTVAEIAGILKERIPESGLSCALIDSASRNGAELLVFEKYFFRAGNCASLSVMLTAENGGVIVDSVGAGAQEGILDFTWGAEEDFALEVQDVLGPMGFTVFEQSEELEISKSYDISYDPVPLGDLGTSNRSTARTEKPDPAMEGAEKVKLIKEERKGLFGKKRSKPDWEY